MGRVGCPSPECVKEGREAGEEELRRAVTEDKIVRWKWLRRKRAVEQGMIMSCSFMSASLTYFLCMIDPTVIHCPMSVCQEPVPKATAADSEGSGWDRLRTCQS